MKKNFLLAVILFCSTLVFAQNQLIVEGNDKGLYLIHKVAPKENFYAIGRLYNVSPKEIETFNGLDMNKGLNIGQTIKIPLTPTNFSQGNSNGRPVYYVVGAKEGLYRVSMKNNNVIMANLRKWNKLSDDNISAGQKLIVGFLVSSEANNIVQTKEPEVKQPPAEEKKAEEKKETVVLTQVPVNKTEETQKQQEPEKKMVPPVTEPVTNTKTTSTTGGEGYFKPQFNLQIKTQPVKADQTASAGIFKTASGWQDGKFYALIDNVEPGTIIKVVNPTNNKAIYAKVLGEMSGIRQNQGYDVRISNAAASALDVSDTDKFIVRVNY
jgi:LysM repeat protein